VPTDEITDFCCGHFATGQQLRDNGYHSRVWTSAPAAKPPRTVVLESRDGRSLEIDLQIHDTIIEEPPTPVSPAPTAQALTGQVTEEDDPDAEPLSRAEQIRQRIAERREELRLEQEEQQSQGGAPTRAAGAAKPSEYQSAIRELMKNKSKDSGSNDKNDG